MGTEWLRVYWLFTLMIPWLTGSCYCHCPASQGSIVQHVPSPGKDQNSNFEVPFLKNVYHFCTIVNSKNRKSNHHESGTVCIGQTRHPQAFTVSLPPFTGWILTPSKNLKLFDEGSRVSVSPGS